MAGQVNVRAELQAAMTRWDELERLATDGTEGAHDAIGRLDVEELRFLVLERVLRDTSAMRAARLLGGGER